MGRPQTESGVAKWWGWGLESKTYPLDDKSQFWPFLLKTLKLRELVECPRVGIEDVKLPPSRLGNRTLTQLKRFAGAANVSAEKYDRLTHSLGRSYPDLLSLRRGVIRNPPDAVVYSNGEDQVEKLLAFARANRISIIPFGGGSSVVGGVEPIKRRGLKGAITLDLRRMNRVLEVDSVSLTAIVEAGISGPQLEDALNSKGFTLGHFPQSFQFSALGGWMATRSAGQQSTKYGKIEDMVECLTLISPSSFTSGEGNLFENADENYPQILGTRRIWVANADGSDKRQLTDDPAYADEFPRWSADGAHIMFVRQQAEAIRPESDVPILAEVWLMEADGSEQRKVTDGLSGGFGYYGFVDWSQALDWHR